MIEEIFIKNKYYRWYYSIVNRALSRTLLDNKFTEKHHIIPKSFGGSNKKENIVNLTPREHYICHLCLFKMTIGKEKQKMSFALRVMLANGFGGNVNSRMYEFIKIKSGIAFKELWQDEAFRTKMRISKKKYWDNIENRKKRSEISKKIMEDQGVADKISKANKLRWKDQDLRKKQSEIQKQLHILDPKLGKKKANFGEKNGMYGKTHTDEIKNAQGIRARKQFAKKSYEELYGIEKAEQLKQQRSADMKAHRKVSNIDGNKNPNAKKYILTDSNGITYFINGNLRNFCKEHRIRIESIINLVKNRISEYKGWSASYAD